LESIPAFMIKGYSLLRIDVKNKGIGKLGLFIGKNRHGYLLTRKSKGKSSREKREKQRRRLIIYLETLFQNSLGKSSRGKAAPAADDEF